MQRPQEFSRFCVDRNAAEFVSTNCLPEFHNSLYRLSVDGRHLKAKGRWFLAISLLGTVLSVLVEEFGSVPIQISVLGCFASIVAGLIVGFMTDVERLGTELKQGMQDLGLLQTVAANPTLSDSYSMIAESLCAVGNVQNPIFSALAEERVTDLGRAFERLAAKELVYVGTEAWRNAYADVLTQSDLSKYRSVSWVRSLNYWQDQPGQQSLAVNCQLAESGVDVTRIIILRVSETCENDGQLREPLNSWMKTQHKSGIRLLYVPEHSITSEQGLLSDFGIYSDVAVGVLETDDSGRSLRFRLSFQENEIERHNEMWGRLMLYAKPWSPSSSS